jgi:hypothetical protein
MSEVSLGSFCGIPASQIWEDFYLWEMLLNQREKEALEGKSYPLNAIVELGTWQGGFSRYLACQARERGMLFRTYDIEPVDAPGFVKADIFAAQERIGAWLGKQGPLVLLCDNGDKPRELRTFPQYLDPWSLVVVHDWGTEVHPEDVPDTLYPLYEEFCEDIGSMSRVFGCR